MYINSKFSSEQKKANIAFNVYRKVLYSKALQIVDKFVILLEFF